MVKNIVFFNQYHNGDCFVGKGWIRNIMQQLPDLEFGYAHANHADIIKDLGCRHIPISELPQIDRMVRIAQDDDGTLFINTWCGAFQGELFGHHQHSNYIIQHRIYEMYCEQLSKILGRPVTQSSNPHDYLPFIDFSHYDTALANAFVQDTVGDAPLVLFCNGVANSGQSAVGNLKFTLDTLARQFQDHVFVATHDNGIRLPNVYYTNAIFNKDSDLNEIAYLSQRAKLIVGKNSGPFSYCCFDENMNIDHTFFCFGKLLTDCLNAGLQFPAQFKFCDQTNDRLITNILIRELSNKAAGRTGMQHIMV